MLSDSITSTAPTITTAGQVALLAVERNTPVQAVDCPSSPPATMDPSTEKETGSVKEGAEATEASKSVSATDNDRDSRQEVPSPTPTTPTYNYGNGMSSSATGYHLFLFSPRVEGRRIPGNSSSRNRSDTYDLITGLRYFPKISSPNTNPDQRGCESRDPRNHTQLAPQIEAICGTPRTVFRAGVPAKRRRFDTASPPTGPSLGAASGQVRH